MPADETTNIAGPQSIKSNGDALHANIYNSSIDGCTGTTSNDYDRDDYNYIVHVAAPLARMQIQVFDPAFLNVGDHCTSNLAGIPVPPLGLNPYISGDGALCTGDQLFTASSGDGSPPVTSSVVRAPSNNSADPTAGPAIQNCTKQYAGYDGALASKIISQTYPFAVFRKWVTLCDINNVVKGDYVVQVRTNVPRGWTPPTTAHHNLQAVDTTVSRCALACLPTRRPTLKSPFTAPPPWRCMPTCPASSPRSS